MPRPPPRAGRAVGARAAAALLLAVGAAQGQAGGPPPTSLVWYPDVGAALPLGVTCDDAAPGTGVLPRRPSPPARPEDGGEWGPLHLLAFPSLSAVTPNEPQLVVVGLRRTGTAGGPVRGDVLYSPNGGTRWVCAGDGGDAVARAGAAAFPVLRARARRSLVGVCVAGGRRLLPRAGLAGNATAAAAAFGPGVADVACASLASIAGSASWVERPAGGGGGGANGTVAGSMRWAAAASLPVGSVGLTHLAVPVPVRAPTAGEPADAPAETDPAIPYPFPPGACPHFNLLVGGRRAGVLLGGAYPLLLAVFNHTQPDGRPVNFTADGLGPVAEPDADADTALVTPTGWELLPTEVSLGPRAGVLAAWLPAAGVAVVAGGSVELESADGDAAPGGVDALATPADALNVITGALMADYTLQDSITMDVLRVLAPRADPRPAAVPGTREWLRLPEPRRDRSPQAYRLFALPPGADGPWQGPLSEAALPPETLPPSAPRPVNDTLLLMAGGRAYATPFSPRSQADTFQLAAPHEVLRSSLAETGAGQPVNPDPSLAGPTALLLVLGGAGDASGFSARSRRPFWHVLAAGGELPFSSSGADAAGEGADPDAPRGALYRVAFSQCVLSTMNTSMLAGCTANDYAAGCGSGPSVPVCLPCVVCFSDDPRDCVTATHPHCATFQPPLPGVDTGEPGGSSGAGGDARANELGSVSATAAVGALVALAVEAVVALLCLPLLQAALRRRSAVARPVVGAPGERGALQAGGWLRHAHLGAPLHAEWGTVSAPSAAAAVNLPTALSAGAVGAGGIALVSGDDARARGGKLGADASAAVACVRLFLAAATVTALLPLAAARRSGSVGVGWGHVLAACALAGPPFLLLLLLQLLLLPLLRPGALASCAAFSGVLVASTTFDRRLWGWACAGAALWRPSLLVSQLRPPAGASPGPASSAAARGRAAVWWTACAAAALVDGCTAAAAALLLAGGAARQRTVGGGQSVHASDSLAALALLLALACAVDDAWALGLVSLLGSRRESAATGRRRHAGVEAGDDVWRLPGSAPKPGAAALAVARSASHHAPLSGGDVCSQPAAPLIQPPTLAPAMAPPPPPDTAVLATPPLPPPPQSSRVLLEELRRAAATAEGRRLAGLRSFFRMNPQLLPGALQAVALAPLPPAWLALLVEVEGLWLNAPDDSGRGDGGGDSGRVDGCGDGSGGSSPNPLVVGEGSMQSPPAGIASASAASFAEEHEGAEDCEPPMSD